MKCDNCGAFFVRYPCPSCGNEDSNASQQNEDRDEKLIRPSQLQGGSAVNPNYTTDSDEEKTSEEGLIGKQKIDDSYLVEQRGLPPSHGSSKPQAQIQKSPSKEQKDLSVEKEKVAIQKTLVEVRESLVKLLSLIDTLL